MGCQYFSFLREERWKCYGVNCYHSLPALVFTALALECFCNQYTELKKGVFQALMGGAPESTRCYLLKKEIILHCALIFREPSESLGI